MSEEFVSRSTISIDASPQQVWDVVTDPAAVKEFMFGADLETDWTVGGPIFWRGEYEGKPYQDKGEILDVEPAVRLVHTHFSPLGGEADEPQNYHTLTWMLNAQDGATQLTLTQDNNPSADAAQHSQGMWDMLLADVKRITESR